MAEEEEILPLSIHNCPKCGAEVKRLGGSWTSFAKYLSGRGSITIRIEFCLSPTCKWTRKLYRIYPNKKWIVVL